MKRCAKCWEELNDVNSSFKLYKWIHHYNKHCKICRNTISRTIYSDNDLYKTTMQSNAREYLKNNKKKVLEYQKIYYTENSEYIKGRVNKWKIENQDKYISSKENYYNNNKSTIKAVQKEYRKTEEYKLCHRINQHRRRELTKLTDDKTITTKSIKEKLCFQNYLCNITWESLYKNDKLLYHMDHIIPLIKWWIHSIKNIQLVIPEYNLLKNKKDDFTKEEYYFGWKNSLTNDK